MSTIRFIALAAIILSTVSMVRRAALGGDPEESRSMAQPTVAIAQIVDTLMNHLSANMPDINHLRSGVVTQKQGEKLDDTRLRTRNTQTRLWVKIDRSVCFMFDKHAAAIAGSEDDLNQWLKPWEMVRILETDWGIGITIQSFTMGTTTYFAVAYSMDVSPVGGYAVNSVRVFGPAQDGSYDLIDSAKQNDYIVVNEVLTNRWDSTSGSQSRLSAELLRLSLIDPCRMLDDRVRIKTTWIYPTGRGILIDWFFDGKELSVDKSAGPKSSPSLLNTQ